ncbi:MAG: DUF2017 domain-containing protein [Mycobacteriales bacterium]
MTGIKRTRRGVVLSFDEVEASLLRHLVGEVRDLLAEQEAAPTPARPAPGLPSDAELAALTGIGGPDRARPDDPALARLLPDAYRDDPGAAGEFRRLTEASLRRDKVDSAQRLLAALPGDGPGEVRLDAESTESWLSTINDVRLALGTRLEVTEEMAEPDPEDPDAPAYVVYLWLTELQGVLVEVADG